MSRVLTTAEPGDDARERDRLAWNLPHQPGAAAAPAETSTALAPLLDASSPMHAGSGDRDLDWQGFRARYFPVRRRHDLAALTAYGAYRSRRRAVDASADRVAPPAAARPRSEPFASIASWEDEGGATPSEERSTERARRPVQIGEHGR